MLNAWALNGADASSYLTGDLNGPTPVWSDQALPTGSWTSATEPSITEAGPGTYYLLLSLSSGGASSGVWTQATEPSGDWSKLTV